MLDTSGPDIGEASLDECIARSNLREPLPLGNDDTF
jgi:hypothetical protein